MKMLGMIRLSYISKHAQALSRLEMANIEVVSKYNNKKRGIKGALLCFGDMFFQTLEGERDKVMTLYEKISQDDRHEKVTLLDVEEDIEYSHFEDWNMNMINLDESTEPVMKPVRSMLSKLVSTFERLDQSHSILKSYTPTSVINMLQQGQQPLDAPLQRTEKIVLFTDLVAFSSMSANLPSDRVVGLLNRYAELVIDCIEEQCGEVGKLIGDGVMAYFDGDQGDQAIQASLNILSRLQSLREQEDDSESPYLRALYGGIGVARGEVIQGNMGSSKRLDYTIIGDSVNLAALLEEMTRKHNEALIVAENVTEATSKDWNFNSLGPLHSEKWASPVQMFTIDEASVHQMISRQKVINLIKEIESSLKVTA
jgi:adenylate cyclase